MRSRIATRAFLRPALAAALLAAFPLTVNAVRINPINTPPTLAKRTTTPIPTPVSTVEPDATPTPPAVSSLSATVQAQRLTTLKTRGDAEIKRRLDNLNAALATIQAVSTLSASNKSTLVGQVETEITGLTALKTKLDADTTLTAARADVQSIITDYRVYALMLPKSRLTDSADHLDVVVTKLTSLETQLQTAINSAKTAGKNVDAMQASLTDMQAKTTAATAATDGLVAKLLALQPSDYNTDHAVLESYRTSLGTADTDAKAAAAADASSIITALQTGKTAASISPGPEVKASPVVR